MMRIVQTDQLETHPDGSTEWIYHFDEPWTSAQISRLAGMGTLNYFPDFPRPVFRLDTPDGLHVKGIQEQYRCRVILAPGVPQSALHAFQEMFNPATSSSHG